jgi:hypothetical protein
MKKKSLNSIAYVLLQIVLFIFIFAAALDIFIITNDMMGNSELVEKVEDKVDKIFRYGSK